MEQFFDSNKTFDQNISSLLDSILGKFKINPNITVQSVGLEISTKQIVLIVAGLIAVYFIMKKL